MDEAFSLVAAQMPRTRRITPFAVRMTVMATIALVLIVGFAIFVAGQQRAADARRAMVVARENAQQHAEALAAAEQAAAVDVSIDGSHAATGKASALLNAQARDAAATALGIAGRLASTSSYDSARPAELSAVNPELLFVDGPSTAPSVISVYTGAAGWAAAVHGANDNCFWVAVTPAGVTRYGTGSTCTGMAALAADRPSW